MQAKRRRWKLFIGCTLLCCLQAICSFAATKVSPTRWRELTGDKEFGYGKDVESLTPEKNDSNNFIQKLIEYLFGFLSSGNKFANLLIWLIVLGVIAYVFYKLFIGRNSFLSRKKKISGGEVLDSPDENIETSNWEALMAQATQNNDSRLAVRYSYMWLLQLLQEKSLIQYTADKTNYEYYRELGDTAYKQPFRTISRQYEYTWYGKFDLSQAAYTDYLNQFNNLKKQLGS
jgi:hypothetical protein